MAPRDILSWRDIAVSSLILPTVYTKSEMQIRCWLIWVTLLFAVCSQEKRRATYFKLKKALFAEQLIANHWIRAKDILMSHLNRDDQLCWLTNHKYGISLNKKQLVCLVLLIHSCADCILIGQFVGWENEWQSKQVLHIIFCFPANYHIFPWLVIPWELPTCHCFSGPDEELDQWWKQNIGIICLSSVLLLSSPWCPVQQKRGAPCQSYPCPPWWSISVAFANKKCMAAVGCSMVMMQPQRNTTIAMTAMPVGAAVPMLFLMKQSASWRDTASVDDPLLTTSAPTKDAGTWQATKCHFHVLQASVPWAFMSNAFSSSSRRTSYMNL